MATAQKNGVDTKDFTVEERLRALYRLQVIMSSIDKIRITRGELPLEVKDLEDEVAGLETRIEKFKAEIKNISQEIANNKLKITQAKEKIAQKEEASNNVANSREFEALSKEIEFQGLEIELAEKIIKKFSDEMNSKTEECNNASSRVTERKIDLEHKMSELNEIINETRQEEEQLMLQAKEIEPMIDERLLTAFKRIRKNARNGLAVVTVDRDACGGCFNKIPPQRQLDIKMRKKIIVCEYCGRILVDNNILKEVEQTTKD